MDKYSHLPLVVCVDADIPRIDKDGIEKPSGITLGKEYRLLRRRNHTVRIINVEGKRANYLQIRFKFVPL